MPYKKLWNKISKTLFIQFTEKTLMFTEITIVLFRKFQKHSLNVMMLNHNSR